MPGIALSPLRRLGLVSLLALAGCANAPASTPEDPVGKAEAASVCAAGPTTPGIDVSVYQGGIDWNAVRGAGYQFAIARINDGGSSDPYFAQNWAGIHDAGMIRGAYQFYEPTMDAAAQANIVIAAVGALGPGDLPVTLDVEWTSGAPNAHDVGVWVDLVTQGTGKRPMIYTAVGYWNQYFNGQFGNVDLWVANWGVSCPSLPNSWSSWIFWQTGGGGVPGIAGDVDQDVFNGTLQDLVFLANANLSQNCSGSQGGACAHFACGCVDDQCSGGFCPGSGCSAGGSQACGGYGCNCADGGCNGGYCPGTGCTAKETNDCGAYGCGCVDHQCNGVFCPGPGCTARETLDCGNYGCGCADHQCAGGSCPGIDCTAVEQKDCTDAGQGCANHQCVASMGASTSSSSGAGGDATSSATGAGGAFGSGGDPSSGDGGKGAGAHPPHPPTSDGSGGASDGDVGQAGGCAIGGASSAGGWIVLLALVLGAKRRRALTPRR